MLFPVPSGTRHGGPFWFQRLESYVFFVFRALPACFIGICATQPIERDWTCFLQSVEEMICCRKLLTTSSGFPLKKKDLGNFFSILSFCDLLRQLAEDKSMKRVKTIPIKSTPDSLRTE